MTVFVNKAELDFATDQKKPRNYFGYQHGQNFKSHNMIFLLVLFLGKKHILFARILSNIKINPNIQELLCLLSNKNSH